MRALRDEAACRGDSLSGREGRERRDQVEGDSISSETLSSKRLFITAFGPFGRVRENPSAILAARLGLPHRVLDVSFEAVESFLRAFDPTPYDGLLMLGAHGGTRLVRIERFARNRIGDLADVANEARPGPIDPSGPDRVRGELWRGFSVPDSVKEQAKATLSAGSYLCNYSYYRAIQSLPSLSVGFLHVPLEHRMASDDLLRVTREILLRR